MVLSVEGLETRDERRVVCGSRSRPNCQSNQSIFCRARHIILPRTRTTFVFHLTRLSRSYFYSHSLNIMRVAKAAGALFGAAVAAALWAPTVGAFAPVAREQRFGVLSTSALHQSSTETAKPCDMPDVTDIPQGVTAKALRSAVLTDINGQKIQLGDKMGSGTSIVIFLRHLG